MGLDSQVVVLGVGKTAFHSAIGAITAGSVCPFSEDDSNGAHPTWAEWGAAQRDLYIISAAGNQVWKENITPGFDRDAVHEIVMGLVGGAASSCAGDISGDGVINVSDVLSMLSAFGSSDGPSDVNADGIVNVSDVLELLSSFGQICSSALTTVAPVAACGCANGEANICCMALLPSCMACSQCCTEDEYCAENAGSPSCGGGEEPVIAIGRPFIVQDAAVLAVVVDEGSDWVGEL